MKVLSSVTGPTVAGYCFVIGAGLATLPVASVQAQDSAFLACAQYEDRGVRIACLEEALDAAVAAQSGAAESSTPAAAAPAAVTPAAPVVSVAPATTIPATVNQAPAEEDASLLDRLRNFGRNETVRVSTDIDGQDQLHDVITTLSLRNELFTITLSSGQVWRQELPKRLNLREGDEIIIYQAGMGSGYRLATPRLSGFIRVERLK